MQGVRALAIDGPRLEPGSDFSQGDLAKLAPYEQLRILSSAEGTSLKNAFGVFLVGTLNRRFQRDLKGFKGINKCLKDLKGT